jgi:hypothetical protein
MSIDDRNENTIVDAGDIISVDFNACMDSARGTVDGHADAKIAAISDTSMTMNFAFRNMASTGANHSLAINGTLVFDISGGDPTGTT